MWITYIQSIHDYHMKLQVKQKKYCEILPVIIGLSHVRTFMSNVYKHTSWKLSVLYQ